MLRKNLILLLIITIFVSLIFGGGHIFLSLRLKDSYSPILLHPLAPLLASDETIAYAPKAREIFDGNLLLTDMYIKEHKKLPSPMISETVPAILMGFLSKITGSINGGFILADFILPPLTFLILSYIIFLLSRNFHFSLFASLVVLFFSHKLRYLPYIPSLIKILIEQPIKGSPSDFLKSFHPQASSPFFYLFILFFLLVLHKNQKYFSLLTGLFLGLLIYTDIFFSSYAFCFVILFLIWSLVKKNIRLIKKLLFVLFFSGIIVLPYIINLVMFYHLPQAQNLINNFQLSQKLPWQLIFLCLFFAFLSSLLKPKKISIFFLIFFVTGLTLLITTYLLKFNINDTPDHLAIRAIYPLGLLVFLLFSLPYLPCRKKSLVWIVLSLILLVYESVCNYHYFLNNDKFFIMPAEEREVFSWLNNYTPKESVVLTASFTYNLLIPALSHNNVFLPFSQYSLASEEEAFKRFFILYKWLDISDLRIKEMFTQTPTQKKLTKIKRYAYDDCARFFLYSFRYGGHNYKCDIPAGNLEQIVHNYQSFNLNPQSPFQNYEADYLLFGPYEKKWANISLKRMPFLKLIKQNKDYQLYQIEI